jgi:hypothetical protein
MSFDPLRLNFWDSFPIHEQNAIRQAFIPVLSICFPDETTKSKERFFILIAEYCFSPLLGNYLYNFDRVYHFQKENGSMICMLWYWTSLLKFLDVAELVYHERTKSSHDLRRQLAIFRLQTKLKELTKNVTVNAISLFNDQPGQKHMWSKFMFSFSDAKIFLLNVFRRIILHPMVTGVPLIYIIMTWINSDSRMYGHFLEPYMKNLVNKCYYHDDDMTLNYLQFVGYI